MQEWQAHSKGSVCNTWGWSCFERYQRSRSEYVYTSGISVRSEPDKAQNLDPTEASYLRESTSNAMDHGTICAAVGVAFLC